MKKRKRKARMFLRERGREDGRLVVKVEVLGAGDERERPEDYIMEMEAIC